jgi:hypothetical protein
MPACRPQPPKPNKKSPASGYQRGEVILGMENRTYAGTYVVARSRRDAGSREREGVNYPSCFMGQIPQI